MITSQFYISKIFMYQEEVQTSKPFINLSSWMFLISAIDMSYIRLTQNVLPLAPKVDIDYEMLE
jgi:hypothetical protein